MVIKVKKREGESTGSLIFRFTKRVKQSGILREAKKRQYKDRTQSRTKRRLSALYREQKKQEKERAKKLGISY